MSHEIRTYQNEKVGKKVLYFTGIDFGHTPMEILEETEKAVLVFQKGHVSYVDRMTGSTYTSPRFMVFLYTIPHKEVYSWMGGKTSFQLEYKGRGKQLRVDAEKQAREWFERANKGEFDTLTAPKQREPEVEQPVVGTVGKELWVAIESTQGYAFISDSCEDMTDDEALQRAKSALRWEKKCVDILTEFIEKHERKETK